MSEAEAAEIFECVDLFSSLPDKSFLLVVDELVGLGDQADRFRAVVLLRGLIERDLK